MTLAACALIVEDNAANLELMRYLLGIQLPRGARHERRARHRARLSSARPDPLRHPLPASTAMIPRRLRGDPRCTDTVVAVTAPLPWWHRRQGPRAGFDGYLSKPIDPETFVAQAQAFSPPRCTPGRRIRPRRLLRDYARSPAPAHPARPGQPAGQSRLAAAILAVIRLSHRHGHGRGNRPAAGAGSPAGPHPVRRLHAARHRLRLHQGGQGRRGVAGDPIHLPHLDGDPRGRAPQGARPWRRAVSLPPDRAVGAAQGNRKLPRVAEHTDTAPSCVADHAKNASCSNAVHYKGHRTLEPRRAEGLAVAPAQRRPGDLRHTHADQGTATNRAPAGPIPCSRDK